MSTITDAECSIRRNSWRVEWLTVDSVKGCGEIEYTSERRYAICQLSQCRYTHNCLVPLVYLSNMLASILVVSMCLSINSCRLWWEQRVVVKVKRADYAQCTLADDSRVKMILNCSEPQRRRRFTILFEPYQSIPRAPEYHPGGRYYFISKYTRNPAVANGSHVRCGVNFGVKQR